MMHLTVDELIEFVSLGRLDKEGLALCQTVTEHIRACNRCLRRVQAFRLIHDEFVRLHTKEAFGAYVRARQATVEKMAEEAAYTAPSMEQEP